MRSGARPSRNAIQFIARGIVPQKILKKISRSALFPMNFRNRAEPVEVESVC